MMTKDQEIEYLRGEMRRATEEKNQLMDKVRMLEDKAEGYAIFGDLMQSIAMLPLEETISVEETVARVKIGMMLHGIPSGSPQGMMITTGLLAILGKERNRLVVSFDHTRRSRSRQTSCECEMCVNEEVAQRTLRRIGPSPLQPHFGAQMVRTAPLTPKEEEEVNHATDVLARLIGKMSPASASARPPGPPPILLALVQAITGNRGISMEDIEVLEF